MKPLPMNQIRAFGSLCDARSCRNPRAWQVPSRVDFSGPKLGEAWTATVYLDLTNRKTVRCSIERGTHISMYNSVPCNDISQCLVEARSLHVLGEIVAPLLPSYDPLRVSNFSVLTDI